MIKELIISIIIVIIIILGDIFTLNYTKKCVEIANQDLSDLKDEIKKDDDEIDSSKANYLISKIMNELKQNHKKLGMYIEHNELEKIETNLFSLNGYIEKEEYGDAMSQIETSIYVLEHIKNKTTLSLINIF